MNQSRDDLTRALTLLQQGDVRGAEAACREILARSPRDAAATHLLGVARQHAGALEEAEQLMRASIEIEPRQADFHSNLAALLRRQRRLSEAESSFRRALAVNGGHHVARLGLARTLSDLLQFAASETECRLLLRARPNDPELLSLTAAALRAQNKLLEAEVLYRQAVLVDPRHAAAHHDLGALLSQLERAEESLEALDRAQALGVKGFELEFNRGRTLAQLYRIEESEAAFQAAVAIDPRHGEAQLNLARLRFMSGDPAFARDLASAAATHTDDIALQMLHASVLRRVGDLPGTETLLRDLLKRKGALPEVRSELAAVLYEAGRLPEAEVEALEAAAGRAADPGIMETLVAILLARSRPEEAMQFIRPQRVRAPNDQGWIAYEATAARLLGLPLYRELYDYDRFVRVYDLEPPPGWSSMEELNAELLGALNERHRFATHPLDQSLRNGSQTARSLLSEEHPAIHAILQSFVPPIEDYRAAIGTAEGHPLTGRNRGMVAITGAWSVQLRREGFHVNHVHPHGWISSAYYVAVPSEAANAQLMSGWLKFGETRYPVPGALAERVVQPRPGRLALFPSYMWHGTNPIHGSEPRTTIAFDASPIEAS